MRPVNLIPPEQRQGSQSPMRTGPLPYIVLGGLVALLLGVAVLVMTSNQIAESKDEIVTLKREDKAAQERAERLVAYVHFAEMRRQRMETISSLADSRFDWERVMRELSKILPSDVWLTELDASASAAAGGEGAGMRASIAGPALEIGGCARGQEGVAGFVTALKEIDGVTRVGVESSAIPPEGTGTGSAGGGGASSGCQTREFIAQFKMVLAFDAAPVPAPAPTEAEVAVAPEAEGSEETPSTTTSTEEG
ncbi:MAG TPA: PilN domain-containing protein [Solirubrobacterales bacterium]|nr:PilN domain-containing protein [Solirubrobacterales bacterium]